MKLLSALPDSVTKLSAAAFRECPESDEKSKCVQAGLPFEEKLAEEPHIDPETGAGKTCPRHALCGDEKGKGAWTDRRSVGIRPIQ